ncbi:ATP-binding protein [Polyangium spumosum]|uniref:histidine kinase n=1 Tax=Polyangium spumosum TaxID=889282 RepID=A0A6N7Q5E5_9BACT|nr:ATP-binding protein [Polyangium spumosum]MRG97905.1 GAF domain-containing protein [Polyangium spumosum]
MDRAGHWEGDSGTDLFFTSDARSSVGHEESRAPAPRGDTHACSARRRLACLEEITIALLTATSEDAVAKVILELGAAALGASAALVALIEDDTLVILDVKGMSEEMLSSWRRHPLDASTPIAMAVRTRAPVFFETEAEWAAICPDAARRATIGPRGPRIAVPLIVGDRVLGGLGFSFTSNVRFSEEDRALAVTLGRQCALALDRARLEGAERKARADLTLLARRLDHLHRTTAALAAARTPLDVARVVVGDARAALAADRAMLVIPSRDGQSLVSLAHEGEAPFASERPAFPLDVDIPLTVAFRTGERLWLPSRAAIEARFSPAAWGSAALPGSVLCSPLVARGCALGVLIFGWSAEDAPDEEGASIVEELVQTSAVALDRALMHAHEDGSVQCLSICMDIRERKQAESELRRAYEVARDADRRKDEFLALLGHELRNPLSPILTALYLMRLKGGASGIEREREVIERQVQHLISLVDDLLDVSRITRGKIQLSTRPLEIARVFSRAIEIASPLFEQKRHELRVDVPAEGLVVDVDETRMAQVLANLLTNAARYTDAGGHIAVAARREGAEVVLSVRDDGCGITPEMLPVIFDLFVQGARGADRAGGGLGLGLGLVRSLVKLHGGVVNARSEGPGKGSEFEVRLPALSPRRASSPELPPLVSPRLGEARRVLVVDDNLDAAQMLAEVLTSHGHEVELAHDGPQALAVAEVFRPEIGILDIGLPVMDGYELALELRAAHGDDLTLVAVTGYGQEHDKRRAFDAGFSRHYVKPVATDALLREVFS